MLFRWFLGMDMVEDGIDHSTFSRNRESLMREDVAAKFLVAPSRPMRLMFGVAVMPKPEDGKPNLELRRRMRYRSAQYMDSTRP